MHTSRGTLLVALLFALTAWLRREIECDVLWSTQTQDDDFFFWTYCRCRPAAAVAVAP